MTRDEVLIEFHEPYNYEIFPGLRRKGMQLNTEAMADEIVRLRTLDNERKARRAAREPIHSLYDILVQLSEENDDLIEERNRLRAILAELTATAQATGQYNLPTELPHA
jgi:hypothetical protein